MRRNEATKASSFSPGAREESKGADHRLKERDNAVFLSKYKHMLPFEFAVELTLVSDRPETSPKEAFCEPEVPSPLSGGPLKSYSA